MDRQFLEFLGSFFLNVAKGQKQLEDMTEWMSRGFRGFKELTDLFCKLYGMDRLPHDSPDYVKAWETAAQNFQKSYREWMNLMNVISKSEYQILEKKCAALEKKVARQDKTIQQLQNQLSEKGLPYLDAIQDFTQMMEEQGHQFQELMDNLGKAFRKE